MRTSRQAILRTDLYVPLEKNDGSEIAQEFWANLDTGLAEACGGYTRWVADGCWVHEGIWYEDPIYVYSILYAGNQKQVVETAVERAAQLVLTHWEQQEIWETRYHLSGITLLKHRED